MNTLYFDDNLKILRDYIKDEPVDLVYLDPPFNSNRNYNVLFKDESGREADSQLMAFEDTALERCRIDLRRSHHDRRQGFRNAPSLSLLHRRKMDDGLSRDDGRPPKLKIGCRGRTALSSAFLHKAGSRPLYIEEEKYYETSVPKSCDPSVISSFANAQLSSLRR